MNRIAVDGKATRAYLVARGGTREHPVIVNAVSAEAAQILARADSVIASFGPAVSSIALSGVKLVEAMQGGATDLRSASRPASDGEGSDC